jgi:hypothetical protein
VGIATFQAMDIPVCGTFGQLEVLKDPVRCGAKVAWEFYVGIAALGLGFLLASVNMHILVSKGRAGMKRLKQLNTKLAAALSVSAGEDNA